MEVLVSLLTAFLVFKEKKVAIHIKKEKQLKKTAFKYLFLSISTGGSHEDVTQLRCSCQ